MTEGAEAAVAAAAVRLGRAGIEAPRREARLILAHALGRAPGTVLFPRDVMLDSVAAARFACLVARRAAGEPLSRMVGEREFWSLPFRLGPATLDPRPDTETLVEAILAALPDRAAALRLLDLGTGTGCILLALLSELPAAWGVAVDRSANAVAVARENARALGLADRASFLVADWSSAIAGRFDVVAANPPYIPSDEIARLAPEVALHDPRAALDGGADGLDAYRRIVPALPGLLAAGGSAALEIGAAQADSVAALMRAAGFARPRVLHDLGGRSRGIMVRANGAGTMPEPAKK
ncbi:MAG: peptide chain release factor N(5)-glutamine methyltransferase [Alphaproteobacteria bacterium]|nr:peptide chain release factor N(5)-glutamine methyltransferase [Alphaproteobacteria bacterium]